MKRIAIIPARGGSKRLPGKNIKEFCGKPMLAYSVTAALESGLFDTVMVSTDSEEIAAVARQYGAEVPFLRSAAASNDTAGDLDVQREVLAEYRARGQSFDQMVYLYPCAPFVKKEYIEKSIRLLDETGAVFSNTVMVFSYPPLRSYCVNEKGRIVPQFPAYYTCRSQDLPVLYHDCGMLYAADLHRYLVEGETDGQHWDRIFQDCVPIVIPEEESHDIDTASDWIIAEQKYRILHGLL